MRFSILSPSQIAIFIIAPAKQKILFMIGLSKNIVIKYYDKNYNDCFYDKGYLKSLFVTLGHKLIFASSILKIDRFGLDSKLVTQNSDKNRVHKYTRICYFYSYF